MLFKCGVWKSLGLQGDPTRYVLKEISPEWSLEGLMLKLKLQCFSQQMWSSDSLENTLKLGRLSAGGEGDHRGWDGWMASSTRWTWVWVDSGSWWWKGRPGVLWFIGSQRVGHDWATELNWTEPMLGKIEGRRRRKWQSMRWLNGITDWMDMGVGRLWQLVMDREAWSVAVYRIAKSWTWLRDWTELNSTELSLYIWKFKCWFYSMKFWFFFCI